MLCIVDSLSSAHCFMCSAKYIPKHIAMLIVAVLVSWNDNKAVGKYLTFVKKVFL
jgi:hypothetical protein